MVVYTFVSVCAGVFANYKLGYYLILKPLLTKLEL